MDNEKQICEIEAYQKGQREAKDGKSTSDNPYMDKTVGDVNLHRQWFRGYLNAIIGSGDGYFGGIDIGLYD